MTSINLAIDKSFTAVGIQKSTQALGEVNQPGMAAHGIASALGGRMVAVGGGIPVDVDGIVVGGIGVVTAGNDEPAELVLAPEDRTAEFGSSPFGRWLLEVLYSKLLDQQNNPRPAENA